MKLCRMMLSILFVMVLASNIYASTEVENNRQTQDGGNFNRDLNDNDFRALADYIATKRNIDIKDKATHLKLSGDVRTEWRHLTETGRRPDVLASKNVFEQATFLLNGPYRSLRGGGKTDPYTENNATPRGLPISKNDFDVEFNLYFKYENGRNYAVAHLAFDNACGVADNGWLNFNEDPAGYHGSGEGHKISLKRCYWGYNLYNECGTRFDIEVGRQKLYHIFESELACGSRMDGIVLYLSQQKESMGEWYWTLAGWVVDERVNHLAYGTEVGWLNIMDQGMDVQYSFINWNKYGTNRFFVRNPNGFRFMVNQLTLTYHLNPEWFCGKYAEIFGAVLCNSDGRHRSGTYRGIPPDKQDPPIIGGDPKDYIIRHFKGPGKNQRWGWYLGFLIGKVRNEGDWSLEVQYQYAGAYAMPDEDMNGIGLGNCLDESITYQRRGDTNWKGWRFESFYAITDNLTLNSKLEFTRQIKKSLGGKHHYSCFEIEAIYAF